MMQVDDNPRLFVRRLYEVDSRTVMHALALAFIACAYGGVSTAVASGGPEAARMQQAGPADPRSIVQQFLLARDSGDAEGAAVWCAPLLELRDADEQWFMDTASTSDWLRQLTDTYHIDRLVALVVAGDTVSWTERLLWRGVAFPLALRSSVAVAVQAELRDGKIARLSGPYPPIPLRTQHPGVAVPGELPATEVPGGTSIPPATMFIASTVVLSAIAVLVARGGAWLRRVLQQTSRHI